MDPVRSVLAQSYLRNGRAIRGPRLDTALGNSGAKGQGCIPAEGILGDFKCLCLCEGDSYCLSVESLSLRPIQPEALSDGVLPGVFGERDRGRVDRTLQPLPQPLPQHSNEIRTSRWPVPQVYRPRWAGSAEIRAGVSPRLLTRSINLFPLNGSTVDCRKCLFDQM